VIYVDNCGYLWCECGNADDDHFVPLDESGNPADGLTGDEKVFLCDRCGAIICIDHAQVRDEPDWGILESELVMCLEVRKGGRYFTASCGHLVHPESEFTRVEHTGMSRCSACGLRVLADKLR
jgi:DNA-directed RNA polymerase subunit RPC12/RpoP